MLIFYLIIFASFCVGLKYNRQGFNSGFLAREQTDSIKGLFILMVFLSHGLLVIRDSGYEFSSFWDYTGMQVRSEFGQLVVVMFLFYSGYGIVESLKKKGKSYISSFPRHRLLTTLLNFDVAVLFFLVLSIILGKCISFRLLGLSLIGWDSLGNSNWYIFVVLLCYSASWLSMMTTPDNIIYTVVLTSCLIFASEYALSILKHGQSWWYNTILCYPAGMLYSLYKSRISYFSTRFYLPLLLVLSIVFFFLHLQRVIPALHGITYNVKSIVFALLIIHLSMKITVGNRFLLWAGANLFPIYIYQRLPMITIEAVLGRRFICSYPFLFIITCAIITGCFAFFYKYWRIQLQ